VNTTNVGTTAARPVDHASVGGYVGFVENGRQMRLKQVRVMILWGDMLTSNEKYNKTTHADDDGNYEFNDLPTRGKLGLNDFIIEAYLTDDKYLQIIDSTSNQILSKRTNAFRLFKDNETMDILFDQRREPNAARIYYYMRATFDFFVDDLGVRYSSTTHNEINQLDHNLPEKVYAFYQEMRMGPKKRFLLRRFAGLVAWPTDSITLTDGYCETTVNPKVYMHEVCHHIMFDLYENYFLNNHTDCRAHNVNHGGDTNPCTCDGIIEGWAEFIPCMMTNNPLWPVGRTLVDTEMNWNHAVDDPDYSTIQSAEEHLGQEFAIAGILWDLYDNKTLTENADLNHDGHFEGNEIGRLKDNVHLSRKQMWDVLDNPHIYTIRDLYAAFRRSGYINDINNLKNIFITHGWDPDAEGWE
jgi:hypothetical protein